MTSAFWPFAFGVKFQRIVARVFARLRFLQGLGLAAEMRHQQGVFVLEAVEICKTGVRSLSKPLSRRHCR
jgi:hypothetical protein